MTLRLGLVAVAAIGAALPGRPAAAEQEYVIWRGTAVGGFEWQPSSGNYASRQACEEGIEGRKRRVARVVAFLRRIGVDGICTDRIAELGKSLGVTRRFLEQAGT
jgi:hypothetical protein